MRTFKIIQFCLSLAGALLGITSLIAGIVTGAWHLFVIAIVASVLAYSANDDIINKKK